MWVNIVDSSIFSLLYPILLISSVVLGFYLAQRYYRGQNKTWKASGIENGVIGIFSLLISFTLLSSNNSLKDRNSLIHQQADALAQMNREAQFLSPQQRREVNRFIIDHINIEMEFLDGEQIDKDS